MTKHLRAQHQCTANFNQYYVLRNTSKTPPDLALLYPLDGSGVPAAPIARRRRTRLSAEASALQLAMEQEQLRQVLQLSGQK